MEPYELPPFASKPPSFSAIPGTISEPYQQFSHQFSDLSTWIDTLVPEPTSKPALQPVTSNPTHVLPATTSGDQVFFTDTWTDQISGLVPVVGQNPHALTMVKYTEEDYGIKLVHALLTCAEAIQAGKIQLAATLINQMTNDLLPRVTTALGIGKVAGFFIEALTRRLYNPDQELGSFGSGTDYPMFYHHFYEATPYLKFSHFTANQAIMEAFDGQDCVHVIDFSLIHGLQWPSLIQALAHRPGGPPCLKITGIGPISENNSLLEVGSKLARLARSVNIPFKFRAVASARLEDIKPCMLECNPKETLAINSVFHLHKLIGSDINSVLNCIRTLNPKIVTLVEQEADHSQSDFLPRFTQALSYYSTMFDSLASCPAQPDKSFAELYLRREISNIICCEGPDRVERHEPISRWRVRMGRAGFKQLGLGQKAYNEARMLLSLFSGEGYCVEEMEGCLKLGWHGRPLITASAWQVGRIDQILENSSVVLADGMSSSNSCSSSC